MSRSAPARTLTHVARDDREAHKRPLDMGLIRRVLALTNAHRRTRGWLFVMVAIRALQIPAMGWVMAAAISGPITQGDPAGTIRVAVWFALLAAFTAIVFHVRMRLGLELGEAVVFELRGRIFAHLQRMPMRFYNKTKLGRIISRMTSDAEAIRAGVQDVLFISLVQGGQMLFAAAVMLYYDWVLFLVVLAMAPVLLLISNYYRHRLSHAWRNIQESFSRVTATLAESVTGIRVTQGFVREDVNADMFRDLVADHADYNLRADKLVGVFLPLIELNNQLFIAVLLVLGGYKVLVGLPIGGGTPGEQFDAMWVFFFMVPSFFGPLTMIGRMYNMALTAMAGAERVFALLDSEPEHLDDADAVDPPPIKGRVEFKGLGFEYVKDTPVLLGISFTAEPGQTVALVGHTGSGKSTITSLIAKFYLPTSGQLLIDGIDIRKIRGRALTRQIGIVLQQNFLFTGSVMDNIRIGRGDASDRQVIEAARTLDCLDLFESLPQGLHTQVGERGGNLSLGQRQLVCFTRAMLADPRILILDEATSSVDTMTEARIQKALAALLHGRTSFVVAHRLSTIRHADLVLVLDQGQVIERGTHNDLLAHGGAYANLYRQFIHASEA
jgi:ABC-type multidrug transport system fused ATPase/permease subunit